MYITFGLFLFQPLIDLGLFGAFSHLRHDIVDDAPEAVSCSLRRDGGCCGDTEILLDIVVIRQVVLIGFRADAIERIYEEADHFVYRRIEYHASSYLIHEESLFLLLESAD